MRARPGLTLIELLVTMVVAGIALAIVSAVCLRQQRIFSDLAQATALAGQLRAGVSILPIDVRGVSSIAGDIREARDTALELRATIASAVVCDTAAGAIVLPSDAGEDALYVGRATPISADDTAWVFTPGDSIAWRGHRIRNVRATAPGPCHPLAPQVNGAGPRTALTIDGAPLTSLIGSPLRVTRTLRYSLYRSTDGTWQLGERDWNPSLARFNIVQPVSGPYLPPANGGLVLRYYDSLGHRLSTPVANTRGIALIQLDLRGQTNLPPRALRSGGASAKRVDSVTSWMALRNRR